MNGYPATVLAIALHVIILAIALWDVFAASGSVNGETVSSIIRRWSISFPILPLVVGIVLGHLFWPFRGV